MISKPDADPRLVAAHDVALIALREITPSSSIGPAADYTVEDDGAVSLRFENRLPGYPGWYWTVTVARTDDEEPTVLELELLPGSGALLAPEWLPWAERLAEYRTHQAELADQAAIAQADIDAGDEADEDADTDDLVDDGDDLADDFDELDDLDDHGSSVILHSGDVDGVDIDELDDAGVDDAELDDAELEDAGPDSAETDEEE